MAVRGRKASPFCSCRAHRRNRMRRHGGWERRVGNDPLIGPPECKRAIRLALDLIALLVDRAVVPATQEREVRELRGPALGPVMDVVRLPDAYAATREATPAVPAVQRPPESRGNRTGPGADLCHTPVRVMTHYDARGVAGQALRRSSWNAQAVLEHGLPRLGRVGQDGGIHVDDHLIALAQDAGIDAVMKRGLGQ